jgi:hypothetical protein
VGKPVISGRLGQDVDGQLFVDVNVDLGKTYATWVLHASWSSNLLELDKYDLSFPNFLNFRFLTAHVSL